jgi:integrase
VAEINVEHSLVNVAGVTTRKAPKNGKARVVTISAPVVAELRRLKVEQAEALLRLGVRQDGLTAVCMGADGLIRSPVSVTLAFRRLATRLQLANATFHTLRHTHAPS